MQSKYGQKIREIREKNNDTLEDLAKKLNMSWSTLGKYERGERKITPEFLEEVGNVYDVNISYFYGDEIEIPVELKELGVEWITAIEEFKKEKISPEEIKSLIPFIKQLKK